MSTGRLERVSIDRPCPKRWSELVGDERRRYCSACALHVTNLSALTRAEAEGFLAASRGRLCVTYVPGPDGRVASQRDVRAPQRHLGHVARAASFLLGLVFLLPGCRPTPAVAPDTAGGSPEPDVAPTDDQRRMGKVRADPVCTVDEDERMILGEMVARDPTEPIEPGPEPERAQE